MTKIVIVACSKTKDDSDYPRFAVDRYTGHLFTKQIRYARTLVDDDHIFILSGFYFFIGLARLIDYYEMTLKGRSKAWCREWGKTVMSMIRDTSISWNWTYPLQVVFLAGNDYYDPLHDEFYRLGGQVEVTRPLEGLGIGKQMQWLNENHKEVRS